MLELQNNLLWVGNALEIRKPKPLFDAGIGAVVDVAYEEIPAQLPRQLIYCRFPINDGGGNDPAILKHIVQLVADFLATGIPTIVACSAGLSRSPAIAAASLARHLGESPVEVLKRISTLKPLDVSGPLWNDLMDVVSRSRDR
jgi:protein-tyrosine phosphatase